MNGPWSESGTLPGKINNPTDDGARQMCDCGERSVEGRSPWNLSVPASGYSDCSR